MKNRITRKVAVVVLSAVAFTGLSACQPGPSQPDGSQYTNDVAWAVAQAKTNSTWNCRPHTGSRWVGNGWNIRVICRNVANPSVTYVHEGFYDWTSL